MRTFFKHMASPHSLLNDGFIRATQLSALNDPFEGIYCKEGLESLSGRFGPVYCDDKETSLVDYVEKKKHRVGVISFTESKDNLTMWAHYANEHKGLVVGFTTVSGNPGGNSGLFVSPLKPSNMFSTTWSNIFFNGEITPVMYRKQARYKVDKFDFDYSDISVEGGDRILFEIFHQKSEEWIYEREHRVILKLEHADKVKIYDIEKIENKKVLQNILRSQHCKKEKSGEQSYHSISLCKIEREYLRESFAIELAKLSINPCNIYLFKINPNSIRLLILGVNCKYDISDIQHDYAKSVGSFDALRARLNTNNYTLYFD